MKPLLVKASEDKPLQKSANIAEYHNVLTKFFDGEMT